MCTPDKGERFLQVLKELREEKENNKAMEEKTKKCTSCGKDFPATLDYFHKDNRAKLGLTSWCKTCSSINKRSAKAADLDKDFEVIPVDFTGHADMLRRLKDDATTDFRSVEQQVLWIINDYFNRLPA